MAQLEERQLAVLEIRVQALPEAGFERNFPNYVALYEYKQEPQNLIFGTKSYEL